LLEIGSFKSMHNAEYPTKELIISVLFQEWPLATSEIYYRVRRVNGSEITYQAIHKQLKLLLKNSILVKNNEKKYLVNEQWLEWIMSQALQLKREYSTKSKRTNYNLVENVVLV